METSKLDPNTLASNAISLGSAQNMICNWRMLRQGLGLNLRVDSFLIPIDDVLNIAQLSINNGGKNVRAYIAVGPPVSVGATNGNTIEAELKLLLVPCQDDDQDMVTPFTGSDAGLWTIYDLIKPCPTLCGDTNSVLYTCTCEDHT